ncbi:MAG: hypothetical protein PHO03_04080 [Candidatus Omnitrophica bacterium]|nr:hypothetical protein [Candidatus Omnitrophota bacterium]
MENKQQEKWYFRTTSLVVGFLLVGPFVLPLVWSHPRFSKRKKIIISSVVIILSCLLFLAAAYPIKLLNDYYRQIDKLTF